MIIILCNNLTKLAQQLTNFRLEPLPEEEAIHLIQEVNKQDIQMRTYSVRGCYVSPAYLDTEIGRKYLKRIEEDTSPIMGDFNLEGATLILVPIWINPPEENELVDTITFNHDDERQYFLYEHDLPEDATIKWWKVVK